MISQLLNTPCASNQDVQADDVFRLHRTAVGQVLAFSLQALAAKGVSQEWLDAAHEKLSTWNIEYLDVLRDIPETIRKEPLPSSYRPSHWKPYPKTYNTRSRTSWGTRVPGCLRISVFANRQ
jgi:hypothetical protein